MKKILFLLLFPVALFGQSYDTQLGKILNGSDLGDIFQSQLGKVRLRHGSTMGKMVFFDTERNIGYQGFGFSPKKGFEIGEFNEYVDLTTTKLLSAEVGVGGDSKVFIHGFLNINNKFFILYSVNDKDKNEERVYINQLSRDMVVLGNPILLTTFDEKKDAYAPLYFTNSPDNKTFAVVREYLHRGITENIKIKAFDDNFNELINTTVDVSKTQEFFVLRDVAITDTKNLYLFGAVDPRAKNLVVFAGAKSKATPFLLAYHAKAKELRTIEIREKDVKQYYNFKFFLTEDNEPTVAAVYKKGRELGYSIYHLSNQLLSVDWKYSGTLSAAADAVAEKYKSDKEYIDIISFTKLLSGEYVVSLESNFITANKNRSFSNAGSIILLGMDQKGGMMWEKIIYKHQRIPDTKLHSSHTAFATSAGLLVVYNDNVENLAINPQNAKFKKLKKTKDAIPVGIEVSAAGSMKKRSLADGAHWTGFTLDMYHFPKIKQELYQFRLSKYGSFGKFETAYGKLQIN